MSFVFKFNDYRTFLKSLSQSGSPIRVSQADIAKAARCQAAYLSQVLKERAELTEDQAFRISTFLNMISIERNYFMTLVQISRASDHEYQTYLKDFAASLKTEALQIRNNISSLTLSDQQISKQYFSEVTHSLVHALTSSSHYNTSELIAKRLNLNSDKVNIILNFLLEAGLVKRNPEGYVLNETGSIHLPNTSELNESFQVQRRLLAVQSIQKNDIAEQVHYSSVFTMSAKDFDRLKENSRDFIKNSHKLIEDSPSEELFALNIDAYRVI